MAKPIAVATIPVITKESVLEVSFDDGTTFALIPGIETIPKVGLEGSFVKLPGIDQVVDQFVPGILTPPAFELVFGRVGSNATQDALIAAADAREAVKFKVTYQTGDIVDFDVALASSYMGEAADGENIQMAGVMGQQTGAPVKSKVA